MLNNERAYLETPYWKERQTDDSFTHREHGVTYNFVKSLYCTPETNVTLYVTYTSNK